MRTFIAFLLNSLFFAVIVLVAVSISTIALAKKVNEYRAQARHGIKGTVVKDEIPVLSFTNGVVKKLYIKPGDEVKKGDLLVQIENPLLKSKVDTLAQFKDNVSAQTEAKVATEELKRLSLTSPVDGIISEVFTTEGSPVESFSKVLTILASNNAKLLSELTLSEYQTVEHLPSVTAYSPRLNQSFTVKLDSLKPNEKTSINPETGVKEKNIGLYFTFASNSVAQSLLNNEDLDLLLEKQDATYKPIDYFVDFWNSILKNDLYVKEYPKK